MPVEFMEEKESTPGVEFTPENEYGVQNPESKDIFGRTFAIFMQYGIPLNEAEKISDAAGKVFDTATRYGIPLNEGEEVAKFGGLDAKQAMAERKQFLDIVTKIRGYGDEDQLKEAPQGQPKFYANRSDAIENEIKNAGPIKQTLLTLGRIDPGGWQAWLSKKGLQPAELLGLVEKGEVVDVYEAIQDYSSSVYWNDPVKYAKITNDIANIGIEFALTKKIVPTRSVGLVFGAQTALQAPQEGETIRDRRDAIARSFLTGSIVGAAGDLPTKIRIPALTAGFMGESYIETKDPDKAIEAGIMVLGFEAVGLAERLGARNKPLKDAVDKAKQYNPDLTRYSDEVVEQKLTEISMKLTPEQKSQENTARLESQVKMASQIEAEKVRKQENAQKPVGSTNAEKTVNDTDKAAKPAELDRTVTGKAKFADTDLDIVGQYPDGRYKVRDEQGQEADIDPKDFKGKFEVVESKKITPQEQAIQKRTVIEEIKQAVADGRTDAGTATLARHIITLDPQIDSNTSLEIARESLYASEEVAKREGLPTHDETGQPIKYRIMGSAASDTQASAARTAIRLYRGHDADTVIEEWYHRGWDRLPPQEQEVYQAYHAKTGDKRLIQEHFAQEGRDFFFSEKLHEKAAPIRQIFEKFRDTMRLLIDRMRAVRGAQIPEKIANMYRQVGGAESKNAGKRSPELVNAQKADIDGQRTFSQIRRVESAIDSIKRFYADKARTVEKEKLNKTTPLTREQTSLEFAKEMSKPESERVWPEELTSARQEHINEDRRSMGLDNVNSANRKSWEQSLDEAIKQDIPGKAHRLAAEIIDNPRPLNDVETAGLVHKATQLKNEHRAAMNRLNTATDSADIKSIGAEAERVQQEFDLLSNAIHLSGTEKGRALASQKLTIDRDFDLASVQSRAKAAKGKELTGKERGNFREMTSKLDEAMEKITDLQKQVDEMAAHKIVREGVARKYSRMSNERKDAELNSLLEKGKKLLSEGCYN